MNDATRFCLSVVVYTYKVCSVNNLHPVCIVRNILKVYAMFIITQNIAVLLSLLFIL